MNLFGLLGNQVERLVTRDNDVSIRTKRTNMFSVIASQCRMTTAKITRWTLLAVILLSLTGGCQASKVPHNRLERWAVVASPKMEETPLPDLLTASLSTESGFDLVERQEIAAVTRELALSSMMGADAIGERLRLGELLGADALVLLDMEEVEGDRFARMVIADSGYGARIGISILPYSDDAVGDLSTEFRKEIEAVRDRFRGGVQRLFGVPPFVSRSLTHDLDYLQQALPRVLEANLAGLPGTAVLELEEARAINRELTISGRKRESLPVLWFVEAEYSASRSTDRGKRIELTIRFTDGAQELQRSDKVFSNVAELVAYLKNDAMDGLLEVDVEIDAEPLPAEMQITRLESLAESFIRLGERELAQELLEACLLIDPEDKDIAYLFVRNATEIVDGVTARTQWDAAAICKDTWRRRFQHWRRGVVVLEGLLRRRQLSRREAIEAGHALVYRAMSSLAAEFPNFIDSYGWNFDSATLREIDSELKDITGERRRFLDDVFADVGELPWEEDDRYRRNEWLRTWLNTMMMWEPYHRIGDIPSPMSRDELHRHLRIFDKQSWAGRALLEECQRFVVDVTFDPGRNFYATFSDDDLHGFLESLRQSSRLECQYCGRLGLLLFDVFKRPGADRSSAKDALNGIEKLKSDMAAAKVRVWIPENVRMALRILSDGEVREEPSSASTESPEASDQKTRYFESESRLSCERLWFKVRLPTDDVCMLRRLYWAEQAGYSEDYGSPTHVIPVHEGQFDIFWNESSLFLHREPGVLEPISLPGYEPISDVCWDGNLIWVARRGEGLIILDASGQVVARLSEEEGLPPSEHTLVMAPLDGGGVIASGSFGPHRRGWIALVGRPEGPRDLTVIHGATITGRYYEDGATKHTVFVPHAVVKCAAGKSDDGPLYLITRSGDRETALLVNAATKAVDRVSIFEGLDVGMKPRLDHAEPISLGDDKFLVSTSHGIYRTELDRWFLNAEAPSRELFADKRVRLSSDILEFDNQFYVPGTVWFQVDKKGTVSTPVGSGPLCYEWTEYKRHYGVSTHFGMLAWDSWGMFYSVKVDACDETTQLREYETLEPHLDECLKEGRKVALASAIFYHDTGLWPQYLDDLVPAYVEEIPVGWEIRWNPTGYTYINKRCEHGLSTGGSAFDLAYVFHGYERGWYVGQDGIYRYLDVPTKTKSCEHLTRIQIVDNALAELDRRIAREPGQLVHLRMKIWYLLQVGMPEAARDTVLKWINMLPDNLEAREALCDVEIRRRTGVIPHKNEILKKPSKYTTYASWRLFGIPSFGGKNVLLWCPFVLPFAGDEADWRIAEYCTLDDADTLLLCKHYGALLALCDIWEAAAHERSDLVNDHSYIPFRAAAYVGRGQYDKARAELAKLDETDARTFLWWSDLSELREAIATNDPRRRLKSGRGIAMSANWQPGFIMAIPEEE